MQDYKAKYAECVHEYHNLRKLYDELKEHYNTLIIDFDVLKNKYKANIVQMGRYREQLELPPIKSRRKRKN